MLGTDLQQQRDEGFNLQDLGSLLHQDVVKLHRHVHRHINTPRRHMHRTVCTLYTQSKQNVQDQTGHALIWAGRAAGIGLDQNTQLQHT